MKLRFCIPLFSLIFFALQSCEVEFSPNGEWKEIPVVYALLDQDDDTTYIRIQRCFLGDGNQYQFAAVADSNYYPSDALTVVVEEWNSYENDLGLPYRIGDGPRQVFSFDYTTFPDKEDGLFPSSYQPVYICHTAGQFDSACIYRLVVTKTASGDTIAVAETPLIFGEMRLTHPNNTTSFNFTGSAGNKSCDITFSRLQYVRRYEPVVRFNYRDFVVDTTCVPFDTISTPHYVDVACPAVKSNMRDPNYTSRLEQNSFLTTIREALEDSVVTRNVLDTVDIFIHCATEDVSAYLYASSPSTTINQDVFTYTNIDGGLGLFGARRTKISFRVKTPLSANSDYIKKLKELGVGF